MEKMDVKVYSLSTCVNCKSVKKLLGDCSVKYEFVDLDEIDKKERNAILEDIKSHNPECSFPTIIIGDRVITGYKENDIKAALGLSEPSKEAVKLYEKLQKIQEPKGYFFNKDKDRVYELIEGLITNRERYGYMSCPCRLATEDRAKDKDIICPCEYRDADVKLYGACYCSLYVTKDWNEEKTKHEWVPERRMPAQMFW